MRQHGIRESVNNKLSSCFQTIIYIKYHLQDYIKQHGKLVEMYHTKSASKNEAKQLAANGKRKDEKLLIRKDLRGKKVQTKLSLQIT